jgi:DNA replication protein DnaC
MRTIEEMMKSLRAMAEEAERREAPFAEMLSNPGVQDGPCPQCALPSPLDRDKTLEESSRHNELRLHYSVCNACEIESRIQRDLRNSSVPSRVCAATFDNYRIYDDQQKDAIRQIKAWITDPSKTFLLLLGSCGTGKGHLGAATCRSFRHEKIKWRTHDEFIGKCHSLDFHDREDYLDTLSGTGLLVFDEMGARTMSADTPERFYRVLDKRYDKGRKTILIGNIPLRSADKTSILSLTGDDRMESRIIETGVVIGCRWGDYRKMEKGQKA